MLMSHRTKKYVTEGCLLSYHSVDMEEEIRDVCEDNGHVGILVIISESGRAVEKFDGV